MSTHLAITGVTGGGAPNRLEINDFVKNVRFFSLYVQALQAMSANDQGLVQSFFSVGGIHGLPFQTRDGATGSKPFDPNGNQWGGYCTHGSVLFPTWHRPYVMLYEQILQQRAVEIAATYTVDTQAWKKAATDLRQPYWDWASNAVPPSQVISDTQVTITNKSGKQVKVDNPLKHYKFHPIDQSFPDPYSSWPTTLRQPDSQDPDATDDVPMLQNILASAQNQITASTYNLLTRVRTWPAFSNHTVGDGGSSSNSLEAIHDGIHVDVGGSGHMSDPSVAAFDPIFFLHHANVDRLLSLWAAINPGKWVTPGIAEGGGSFTTPPGTRYDQNTVLTPFWNQQTTFWASAAVTNTSTLGYSYPEFNGLDVSNTSATKTAISNIVNQLYGSGARGSFTASSFAAVPQSQARSAPPPVSRHGVPTGDDLAETVPAASSTHTRSLAAVKPVSASHSTAPTQQHPSSAQPTDHHQQHHMNIPSAPPSEAPQHGMFDWTARLEFKKYELGSSFSVLLFLGEVPENPRQWRISHNFVGANHAFVNGVASRCANCTNQQDLVVEGFVHLNNAIAQHSGLGSLDPDVVQPYLTSNLHWRVQKTSGEVAELQSLEVAVIATPLTYPPGAVFPVPGQGHRYNQITHGRNGGSRHA